MTSPQSPKLFVLAAAVAALFFTGCQSLPREGLADPRGQMLPTIPIYSDGEPEVTLPTGFQDGGVLVIIYKESGREDALEWMDAMLAQPLSKPAIVVETNPEADLEWKWNQRRLPADAELEDVLPLIQITGSERPDLARVIYFNDAGNIVWLWDGGYHALKLDELRTAMRP